MKVLFLGSSHFSEVVLEKMLERGVDVCGIITQPDKPAGRGHKLLPTEVKVFGQKKGIEVYCFDRLRKHIDEVKKIDYDLSVVASFGQILPDSFLEHRLCINAHPSLLPKYRGPSPIQNTILNGDEEGGVSIMKVASEVDAGDIIAQSKVNINGMYFSELESTLATLGGEMVADVIKNYERGQITFSQQNHDLATFTRKFTKEDGVLDFSLPARDIVNRVRALAEEVGCEFYVDQLRVKVEKAEDVSGLYSLKEGEILNSKKHFVIGSHNGAIEITSCQAPSGKKVSGRDFLNGHNDILSKVVTTRANYVDWSED